ncbi:TPA: hypothetical protein NJ493_004514 [Vibrio parahaemolyticus]|nr:hypothetical protein [Vibrio parahaemolyticus]HCG7990662.1 hypothetical protein [Vibrio parahaemolyticus]
MKCLFFAVIVVVLGYLMLAEDIKNNLFEQKIIKKAFVETNTLSCDNHVLNGKGYNLSQFSNVKVSAQEICRKEIGKNDIKIVINAIKNVVYPPTLAAVDMVITEVTSSNDNYPCVDYVNTLIHMCPDLLNSGFDGLENAFKEIE